MKNAQKVYDFEGSFFHTGVTIRYRS